MEQASHSSLRGEVSLAHHGRFVSKNNDTASYHHHRFNSSEVSNNDFLTFELLSTIFGGQMAKKQIRYQKPAGWRLYGGHLGVCSSVITWSRWTGVFTLIAASFDLLLQQNNDNFSDRTATIKPERRNNEIDWPARIRSRRSRFGFRNRCCRLCSGHRRFRTSLESGSFEAAAADFDGQEGEEENCHKTKFINIFGNSN